MTKFVPNPGMSGLLARTVQMRAALHIRARLAAEYSRALAPRDSGDYANSIVAVSGINDQGEMAGRVVAKDFKAKWIEFGTMYMPPFAPLRLGAEGVGLKVRRTSK